MTFIIIAITCIVSYMAFNNPQLRANMLFVPAAVKERGEMYRFITHGFIHADFMHLLLNMYALYIFGGIAEATFTCIFGQTLGNLGYLLFYLAAIVASSYVSYMRHKDSYSYASLGASGAVAAMIWPFVMYDPWDWFIFPPLPSFLLGIGYIAYSHYADKKGGSNIGHNAHLWGAIFGLLAYTCLCLFLQPEILTAFIERLMEPRGMNAARGYFSPCG